jgi:transcriptional regulator with XRE-family HTH domain
MAMTEVAGATYNPLRLRVAAEVRAWRARRSMTQVQLAKALGLSQAQVSSRLRGETPITLDEIERLATIFGCSPEELMQPALRDFTPASGLRITSAQRCPASETVTVGDQLAERRKRRQRLERLPHLPEPVVAGWPRHLRLVGA